MDFFQAQDDARQRTRVLIALFAAAVVAIVIGVYVVVVLAIGASIRFEPRLFAGVAGAVLLLVGGGSAYRTMQLRQGGPVVAGLLGGQPVDPATDDPDERRLVNVVEEMAIASGVPVPAIYVLPGEESINAFAAGYGLHDAAVAVTRGALKHLTRDELQGVIAHEFSHILNGDMRLNIRLIGLLHGLLLLALIGRVLLRSGGRSRSRRKGKSGGVQIALIGLGLLLLGYIGVFFGKLIKAAASRQREYLADAAAVQFTRNPEGIAGALKKIGALGAGSRIVHPRAEELSHLYFASGLKSSFAGLFATHPPLVERIRRIDPSFDGDFERVFEAAAAREALAAGSQEAHHGTAARHGAPAPRTPGALDRRATGALLAGAAAGAVAGAAAAAAGKGGTAGPPGTAGTGGTAGAAGTAGTAGEAPGRAGIAPGARLAGAAAGLAARLAADGLVAGIGAPAPEHLDLARGLVDALPAPLHAAAHSAEGAPALVFALLLAPAGDVGAEQRETVRGFGGDALLAKVEALLPLVREAGPRARLPLLDMALPALRALEPERSAALGRAVRASILADGGIHPVEFAIYRILARQLGGARARAAASARAIHSVIALREECAVVLSALAYAGARDDPEAEASYTEAARSLPAEARVPGIRGRDEAGLAAVDRALERLARGSPGVRRRVLLACSRAIVRDRVVTMEEVELFRAVAEALDCPVPPSLAAPTPETAPAPVQPPAGTPMQQA
ncbi:MAG TPA: M48 family metallopeptidase [Longimicrobiales bacterium]